MMDSETLSQELTPLQIQAIRALLSERTQTAAAEKIGVSRVTLWRWLQKPVFRQAVIAGRRVQIDALWAEITQRRLL